MRDDERGRGMSGEHEPRDGRGGTDVLALERFLPYRLSVLANTVSRSVARLYEREFGLSIPEWRIIAVLGRFGPQTQSGLVAKTAMDKVRLSRAAQRAEKAGLIRRAADPEDRRRTVLRLSERGQEVFNRIGPRALGVERSLLAALSEGEQAELDRLLTKLQARADAMDSDAMDADALDAGAPDEPEA